MICEIKDAKAGGTYVVAGTSVDEVQTLLDDQIVKTQTISVILYYFFLFYFYNNAKKYYNKISFLKGSPFA